MRLGSVLLLTAFLAATSVFAAPKKNAVPKKIAAEIPADVPKKFSGQELVWVKSRLSPEYLQSRIDAVAKNFTERQDCPFPELRFAIDELKSFDRYYFFEADTEISRRWIKSNIAFAEALLKARGRMNFLILNKQTQGEEYRKWYDYYVSTAKGYLALVRKPIKVTDKALLSRQRKIKKAVQARIQAEEKAEEAQKPKLQEKKK